MTCRHDVPHILSKVWWPSVEWRPDESSVRTKVKTCMHQWFTLANGPDLPRTRLNMLAVVSAVRRRRICVFRY